MNKKNIIKEMYNNKLNKEKNYENILKRVEKDNNNYKIALVPLCIVAIVIGISVRTRVSPSINNECDYQTYSTSSDLKYVININELDKLSMKKIDGKIVEVYENTSNYNNILDNKILPNNFKLDSSKALFIKDKNGKYNILRQYINIYSYGEKNITIQYSNTSEPLRDYYFEDGTKSIINGKHMIIYRYENSYFTSFSHNGTYYDIECENILEDDLINLLSSIIQ